MAERCFLRVPPHRTRPAQHDQVPRRSDGGRDAPNASNASNARGWRSLRSSCSLCISSRAVDDLPKCHALPPDTLAGTVRAGTESPCYNVIGGSLSSKTQAVQKRPSKDTHHFAAARTAGGAAAGAAAAPAPSPSMIPRGIRRCSILRPSLTSSVTQS